MAARLNRKHSAEVREKIRSSVIIDRFQKHFMGELELSMTQIKVGDSLLDRSVPKLSNIQHSGDKDHPIEVVAPWIVSRSR